MIRGQPWDAPYDCPFMTLLSTAQFIARDTRKNPRGHMVLIVVAGAVTAGAIALVAYLLWPTWEPEVSSGPARLPVSIGATLFNVPTAAIRMKIQRHSGPQERVDLNFSFPSLEAPEAQKRVSASSVDEVQPIDRIFLSISAHHDALAPDMRERTIYPRYLEQASTRGAATPGMCLSERRIDGADLTFRFPRSWLAQWREVTEAMDRLTQQLQGPKG
jgi:hypothetical protein